jgi:zinc transport system substrate-binding protein
MLQFVGVGPIRVSFRALILWLCLFSMAPVAGDETRPLAVVASIQPLQWLVERVGGEAVEARALVGPGQSPATYEPTPKQMASLARARLYVRVGVPFERAWLDRMLAASPQMSVLDLRDGLKLRPMAPSHHHHGDGSETEALDPHVWTSPRNLIHMAGVLRDRLARLDPTREATYGQNYRRLVGDLEALDHEIRSLLEGKGVRRFLVYHPSWGYFADTYGLEQIPIEREGKPPGPRSLAALIERARAEGLETVLVQRQFDRRTAQTLAQAIGGRVCAVDPLAYDLPTSLREVAGYIAGQAP